VFLVIILLYFSVSRYLELKTKESIKITLFILFIIDFIVAMTNNLHFLFNKLPFNDLITLKVFNQSDIGVGFLIHTALSYGILIVVFIKLFVHFFKKFRNDKDLLPFIVLILGILVGFAVNITHVFFYSFTVDPSLIVFIIFNNLLYFIFYIRDLKLIFRMNNHRFILENFREMYLVVDTNGIIVDASEELKTFFELPQELLTYIEAKSIIEKKAIIYRSADDLDEEFNKDKIYLHVKEIKINMPFFKYSGRLFLFYDETSDQKLLYETDYLMSHDIMTKLYNRNYFESMRDYYDQPEINYSIILFDLDGLKLFNDTLGHKSGDNLLIRFSEILIEVSLKSANRKAIRLGGDEFMLILENDTDTLQEEVIKSIETQAYHKNPERNVGFSFGIASKKGQSDKISNVIKRADDRLYKMKDSRIEYKKQLMGYFSQKSSD
jgi:diguanylate cyclase (GGDEF)-like protein